MDAFGVSFRVADHEQFKVLQSVFYEVKKDKEAEEFRDPKEWVGLVPDVARSAFAWPSSEQREEWLAHKPFTPIAISDPADQLGRRWDFYRVFESFEEGEYSLLSCEMVDADTAEMRIDPWSYPYGGVGPFIALAEAFGFSVLGVNECGRYESRSELQANAR